MFPCGTMSHDHETERRLQEDVGDGTEDGDEKKRGIREGEGREEWCEGPVGEKAREAAVGGRLKKGERRKHCRGVAA